MMVPPIRNADVDVVSADADAGVDVPEALVEPFLPFLLFRIPAILEDGPFAPIANASGDSFCCEKARDKVRGRKNPSLPRGILKPWTT